jgi:hypothetical protein
MEFKVGDQVAWDRQFSPCFDDGPMSGVVTFVGFTNYDVRRVDGGICTVKQSKCRIASLEDIQSALDSFKP